MRARGYQGFEMNALWVIIIINFLMYIVTSIRPGLAGNLGLTPVLFSQRPWTLLTAMFVHADLWHILFNMLGLFVFGRTLLMLVGTKWFLLVYFVGGILGNFIYLLWGLWLEPFSFAVGASGAVYAVAGALVVMVPNSRVALWGIIPMPLWVFVIIFLVLLSLPPFVGQNIAWQAHMGGLAAGLIAGYFFKKTKRYYAVY